MKQRIAALQVLRALAATMVVYHHSAVLAQAICGQTGVLGPLYLPEIGTAGVDIFFVVSGFVIALTGPLAGPRPSAAAFFWRRFSRVAPLFYLLSLGGLVMFLYPGPLSVYEAGGRFTLGRTAATLFFWPAVGPDIVPPYLSTGWTLCLEMIFYTGVSLLLIGGKLRRNLMIALAAIIAVAVLSRLAPSNGLNVIANPIFLEFAIGVVLAMAWPRLARYPLAIGAILIAGGLDVFGVEAVRSALRVDDAMGTLSGANASLRLLLFGLPSALVVMGALILNRALKGVVVDRLSALGDASYSLYLIHLPVLFVMYRIWRLAPAPAPWIVIVSATTLSVLAGLATYRWVERPLIASVRHLGRPRTARAAAAATA